MAGQYTESQNGKAILIATMAGLVFVTLFCKLDGAAAQGCHLLGDAAWAALEVLRLAVMLTRWNALAAYLYENSRFVEHLLQIGASLWPWLCAMAG